MTQQLARRVVLAIAAIAVVLAGIVATPAPQAQAADASGWDPGYIISDELFYNGNAMSEVDVAWFLRHANQSPCVAGYTCLKDYTASTWTRPADAMCGQYTGGGVETAAAIITKVGQACGISQRVLIVLLQKEQSLVTHTSPSASRYGKAMGYACPDTAPCDAEYFGFYNQVYKAAWQFKRYGNPPGTSSYFTWIPVGKVSQIQYHPNIYCHSSAVLIRNRATAALYYYTPYQPNPSALANLYGTGDECGSYGNRNFWRLYSDWFGSPNGSEGSFLRLLYQDVFGRAPEDSAKSFWLAALRRGESRYSVATSLLASPEYRAQVITANYMEFLGRAPESSGMDFWLRAIANGDLRTDELRLDFLASEEYYNNCGRSQDCFVNAMFVSLLGRPAPPDALAYYAGTGDTAWRKLTLSNIYRSPESVGIRVNALYMKYLGRGAGSSDQAYWLSPVQAGGDPVMLQGIFGSPEYDARAKIAYPNG